jgi:AcrR family transcriptional regulator
LRVAVDHRDTILQTAAKLFARSAFHEVLMEEVAVQAGIAKGTLYRYFANKDELFGALSMSYMEMLASELAPISESDRPAMERLRAMLRRLGELIHENNDFFQVMQRHESNVWAVRGTEFLTRRNALRDCLILVLRDAEKEGKLSIPFSPVYAADMLLGSMRNLLRFSDPQMNPLEMTNVLFHVFSRGLATETNK